MKRSRIIIPATLFLISFGVYLKTLAPTVTGGDSGELIANAYILGITHPTGHPLYCLLGRLFTFLPFGSVAYRTNLMSALFASLTVVLVYLIVLKIQINGPTGGHHDKCRGQANGPTGRQAGGPTGRLADWQTGRPFIKHIPPIIASLVFAFSKSFWKYAVRSEIYILKAFFLALLILILLKWREACSLRPVAGSRYLYLFALIYGLSFSNHITMALFFPTFLYFVLITDWRTVFNPKNVILVILLFTLGLSLYLYLPFRSLHNPPLDWGDPETLKTFLHHVSGAQYHFRLFDLPFNKIPAQIKRYGLIIFKEFTWLPLALGIFGLFSLIRRKKLLIFTGLLFLIEAAFNLSNFEIELPPHLYISSFLIFSLWIGWGMERIIISLTTVPLVRRAALYFILSLLLLIPLVPAVVNYQEADQSQDYWTYDLGKNILESLEKDAILIGGDAFTYWYLQYGENQRQDVITICQGHTSHSYPWYLRQLKSRYPELVIAPEGLETGMRIKDREFIYPVTEEILKMNEAQAKEEKVEGQRGPFTKTTTLAITRYMIAANLDHRPVYLGFAEDIELIIPEGCYPVSNGLLYQVKRGVPRLVVERPRISHRVEANFSNELLFLGYDIDKETIAQGDTYSLTYYWKILKRLEKPPKIITLFTDEEGRFDIEEEELKFYEAHFLGYNLPPDYRIGEVIREKYCGMVPSDIPPRRYYLALTVMKGKEVLTTSTPLSKTDPFLSLGEIEVLPRGKRQ